MDGRAEGAASTADKRAFCVVTFFLSYCPAEEIDGAWLVYSVARQYARTLHRIPRRLTFIGSASDEDWRHTGKAHRRTPPLSTRQHDVFTPIPSATGFLWTNFGTKDLVRGYSPSKLFLSDWRHVASSAGQCSILLSEGST